MTSVAILYVYQILQKKKGFFSVQFFMKPFVKPFVKPFMKPFVKQTTHADFYGEKLMM
jgi:hypothetical protein